MAEPTFWDSLLSVGVTAASTTKSVLQGTFGTLSGAANAKIAETANKVQGKVADTVKPAQAQTSSSPTPPASPAAPKAKIAFGVVGALLAGVLIYVLVRQSK